MMFAEDLSRYYKFVDEIDYTQNRNELIHASTLRCSFIIKLSSKLKFYCNLVGGAVNK